MNGVVGVHSKAPVAGSAAAVQAVDPSTLQTTVELGSAMPLQEGVTCFVNAPSTGALTTGAPGAAPTPTVKLTELDGAEAFPA